MTLPSAFTPTAVRGAAAPSEMEVSTTPSFRIQYMAPTAQSTWFQRVSLLEIWMSTVSPGWRERMVSCSHSPLRLEMDRRNLPLGMAVEPVASMTFSTVQETVEPIFRSPLGERITSTPGLVLVVVGPKSSVKR